jgi:outer membrane protein assembly factor BamB
MPPIALLLALATPSTGASSHGSDATAHWPHWRGPTADGVVSGALPTAWSDSENVRWIVAIPGRGMSTPIVVGERLFLTTAVPTDPDAAPADADGEGEGGGRSAPMNGGPTEQSFEVHCLDRATGAPLWKAVAKVATPHEGYHKSYGSWASASPITDGADGGRLYVSFGTWGTYAYDLAGKLVWSFDPGVELEMRNAFGEGHAPVLAGDALVQVYDHEGQSFAFALDKRTGKELWRVERDEPSGWATPLVTRFADALEVVTSAPRKTRSYDVATGKLLWEGPGAGLNAIPTVLRHADTVLVMSGFREAKILALTPLAADEETSVPVAWTSTKGCGYTASPVLHGGLYYTVTDRGQISCFDALSGEAHYLEERLPRGSALKSSPIAAGDFLYVPTEAGEVHLVKLGTKYEVAATNVLTDQVFVASPAAAPGGAGAAGGDTGDLYLRSLTHLVCISEAD